LPARPELGGLDIVLAQATVPDALVRSTAEEITTRLSGVVPDEAPFVKYDEPAPSLLGSFSLAEPRQSVGFRPPSPNQIVSSPRSSPTFGQSPARHGAPPRRSAPGAFDDLAPIGGGRSRSVVFAAVVLLVILLVGGGLAWKFGYLSSKHTVPPISGLTLSEASSLVKSDDLTLSVTAHASSATVKSGDIISQTPLAGASVSGGSILKVVVSSGPPIPPVTMPTTLLGMTCTAATSALSTLGVHATCSTTQTVASATIAKDLVGEVLYGITKNPTGVPKGATVVLVPSSGPSAVTTTTAASATTTTSASTNTTTTTTTTTVPPTTTTTLHPATLKMPNVVGMNQSEVGAAMKSAGLFYKTVGPGAGVGTATPTWTSVVSEVPAAGTVVPYRSTVTLHVTK
jgi:beta-lactam-binding protein with PASTA domain